MVLKLPDFGSILSYKSGARPLEVNKYKCIVAYKIKSGCLPQEILPKEGLLRVSYKGKGGISSTFQKLPPFQIRGKYPLLLCSQALDPL